MDEQQSETMSATTDEAGPDDSEPTPERQAELRKVYEANVAVGKPPYAGAEIRPRGELTWIFRERGWDETTATTTSQLPDLRGIGIVGASLQDMNLIGANLSGAILFDSDFSGADMSGTNLTGIWLHRTKLNNVDLTNADLTGAIFGDVTFSGASMQFSILRGTVISGDFTGTDFTHARMDATTVFGKYGEEGAIILDASTRLLDVSWNGANLALVNWNKIPRLGDEADIRDATSRNERVQAYRAVARAYFGLAKALEAQGLTAPALRYRRRQHQLDRAAQLRSFNLLGWFFSAMLNIVSGYGDRPLRALGVYLAVILAFAGVYFGITTPDSPIFFTGSQPLQFHEAVLFSLSSFHRRGFFPSTIGLGDPVAIVAALEAIVGLFIELVLIATFTRRLFER